MKPSASHQDKMIQLTCLSEIAALSAVCNDSNTLATRVVDKISEFEPFDLVLFCVESINHVEVIYVADSGHPSVGETIFCVPPNNNRTEQPHVICSKSNGQVVKVSGTNFENFVDHQGLLITLNNLSNKDHYILIIKNCGSVVDDSDIKFIRCIEQNLGLVEEKIQLSQMGNINKYAIINAKQEWEATADTIKNIVCLIDKSGKIIRANKRIEQWGLNWIGAVIGKTIFEVFDPMIKESRQFLDWWTQVREFLGNGQDIEETIELVDDGKYFLVTLKQLVASKHYFGNQADAVFIVEDITLQKNQEIQLKEVNHDLEALVQERTGQLSRNYKTLRRLSREIIDSQENERKRIAGGLHDGIGQCLGAIKFGLEGCVRMMSQGENVVKVQERLGLSIEQLQDAIAEVRRVSMDLRPSVLDDLGLVVTINWMCREHQKLHHEIAISSEINIEECDVPENLKLEIYRILQEAMNNIIKHANATEIEIDVFILNRELTISIRDNGDGFNLNDINQNTGFGLRSMRERAESTDAIFDCQSKLEKGTQIKVTWVLSERETVSV